MRYLVVIFSVFLLSTFLSSQEINQNVKNFSQLPDVYDVKISPNGKMVGVLREIDQERMVSIIDLQSKKLLHNHRFIRKGQIGNFEWLSNERILFSRRAKFSGENRLFPSGELYATNIDGKKSIMLTGPQAKKSSDTTKDDPRQRALMINKLEDDPEHILIQFFTSDRFNKLYKLNTNNGEVIFSITPDIYRAAGQQIIICKLLPKTIRKQGEKELIENLLATFQNSPDAIIFTDVKGAIQYTNERFLDLTNNSRKNEVVTKNLSEFLGRGEIDLAIMLENVMKSGAVKIYSTHLKSSFGTKIDIEASVSRNNSDTNGLVAFIVREVSSPGNRAGVSGANTNLEKNQDEVAAKELVGSATLKEIVTDTTDVIEKICIEAALEITNNNRAAAADLLGLSRQSLYVKLSKFEM